MNVDLEQALRELFADDAASYQTAAGVGRLRARVHQRRSRRRMLFSTIGLASSGVAAAIAALVLSLSSATPLAYAGWTATPAVATPSALATASHTCASAFIGPTAAPDERAFSQQPVLSETRGIYTGLVEVSDEQLYTCLTAGDERQPTHFEIRVFDYGAVQASPGTAQISAPYERQAGLGSGFLGTPPANLSQAGSLAFRAHRAGGSYGTSAVGQAGSDVRAVSFTLANGTPVLATVQGGWYFAWWPWPSVPTSVTVTTASGTSSSPLSSGSTTQPFVPDCQPGSSGCVFSNTVSILASGRTSSTDQTTTAP